MLMIGVRASPQPADVQDAAHSLVSWLSGALEALSPIDYVLLGLALVIFYFLRRCLAVMTSPVAVEVELLDADGESKPPVHALTASLRERLAGSGLSAPVVPSGTPQVGLVDAVAASPLPQAAFIAKLMEALPIPEPLQYKLGGSVTGASEPAGIRLWLRPYGRGRQLMRTLPGKGERPAVDHEEVVESAAFEVYSFISTEALRAFPPWTRWRSAAALGDYRVGLDAAERGRFDVAKRWLGRAASSEPDNALAWLQLANVYERIAYPEAGAAARKPAISTNWQAKTLRRYLWVADQWPWLVQARYRASVLAGALANACEDGQEIADAARSGLGLTDDADVQAVLTSIAKSESDFALQLLKPWYMLVRWRRTRSQFEPGAEERRQLKRAVGISRQALRVRRLPRADNWYRRLWNAYQVAKSEVAVRWGHLSFGLIAVDWQTEYVAACFDSLLLGHATRRFPADAQAATQLSPPLGGLAARRRRWWINHLRKQAFRRLERAISEGGRSLPSSWVLDEDPDLRPLRELGSEWAAETEALLKQADVAGGESQGDLATAPTSSPAAPGSSRAARVPPLCAPTRPWPKPGLRIAAYTVPAVATAVLAVVLQCDGWAWFPLLSASFLFCLWRAFLATREHLWRLTITDGLHPGADRRADRRASRLP